MQELDKSTVQTIMKKIESSSISQIVDAIMLMPEVVESK